MSEFTNTKQARVAKLKELAHLIINTGNAHSFIVENQNFIPTVIPNDFITLFDELIKEGKKPEELKILTNKVLNIFHIAIRDFERIAPSPDSFLGALEQNNREMQHLLDKVRPIFKAFLKDQSNADLHKSLTELFTRLEVFVKHYTIKENVLFPVIEQTWPDYRCLQIMWSFHDDIRRNLKTVLAELHAKTIDLKRFNKSVGDLFFQMLAIKFREEHILFPEILSSIPKIRLDQMTHEGLELGFPYTQPKKQAKLMRNDEIKDGQVNLGTGQLSIQQIKLIFNHLPVDITYVDEDNKVCYFSTPKKRIFPRTVAIIGRKVSNCHPPESVHVVEQIVASFKSGEKDHADFWIKMKGEYILIQYFAVRDESKNYKGVLEVSQEISKIKALEGENRLLDW